MVVRAVPRPDGAAGAFQLPALACLPSEWVHAPQEGEALATLLGPG